MAYLAIFSASYFRNYERYVETVSTLPLGKYTRNLDTKFQKRILRFEASRPQNVLTKVIDLFRDL